MIFHDHYVQNGCYYVKVHSLDMSRTPKIMTWVNRTIHRRYDYALARSRPAVPFSICISSLEATRAQRGAFARAHAIHRNKLGELIQAICGCRHDVPNSTNMKLLATCALKRYTRQSAFAQASALLAY